MVLAVAALAWTACGDEEGAQKMDINLGRNPCEQAGIAILNDLIDYCKGKTCFFCRCFRDGECKASEVVDGANDGFMPDEEMECRGSNLQTAQECLDDRKWCKGMTTLGGEISCQLSDRVG